MGYRSEVLLAIAFENTEQMEEVWAIYCLDPKVQATDVSNHWSRNTEGKYPTMAYYTDYAKWYDDYEDVQAFEHMRTVAETFVESRKFNYAWIKYRIGEENNDIEVEELASDAGDSLSEYLWERAAIVRHIEHSF